MEFFIFNLGCSYLFKLTIAILICYGATLDNGYFFPPALLYMCCLD